MEQAPKPRRISTRTRRVIVCFGYGLGVVAIIVFGLFAAGLLKFLTVPTASMKPAVNAGEGVVMEGVSYLFRAPRVGEIVVFLSDGLGAPLPAGQLHMKRLVGMPGDRVRISEGKLYVNDAQVPLANSGGEIGYTNMESSHFLAKSGETVTVPVESYFVLGDNSAQSMDSREFGAVPAKNLRGRIIGRK